MSELLFFVDILEMDFRRLGYKNRKKGENMDNLIIGIDNFKVLLIIRFNLDMFKNICIC